MALNLWVDPYLHIFLSGQVTINQVSWSSHLNIFAVHTRTRTVTVTPITTSMCIHRKRPAHAREHTHPLPYTQVEYTRLAIFMIVHALHFNFYLGTFIQQIADVYVRDPSVSGPSQRLLLDLRAVASSVCGSLHEVMIGRMRCIHAAAACHARAGAEVDQTEISNVVQSFSLSLAVCMPVCGVMAIPLVGYILDSRPLRSGGFLVCNMTGVLYGGLALVPVVGVQWLTIVVLSVHRVFLFASLFAYSGSRFGPANFGSIVGVTTFLASVCGLLQYVLALLAEAYGYVAINLVVLLMLVPLFVLPY